MGHLVSCLNPFNAYGGFRVQGRSGDSAREIARQATALEELGAFAIVLECVPASLAREITESCSHSDDRDRRRRGMRRADLVLQDLLGMTWIFARSLPARSWTARAACWTPSHISMRR